MAAQCRKKSSWIDGMLQYLPRSNHLKWRSRNLHFLEHTNIDATTGLLPSTLANTRRTIDTSCCPPQFDRLRKENSAGAPYVQQAPIQFVSAR
jgi:hypothetical protein